MEQKTLAVALHGVVPTGTSASYLLHHTECTTSSFGYNDSLAAHIRLVSGALIRHVVDANVRAGIKVSVYVHSWSPAARKLIDELLFPVASIHEVPNLRLNKQQSQALSAKKVLSLIPPWYSYVYLARHDVLLFSNVLVSDLKPPAQLWLPQSCVTVVSRQAAVAALQACGCHPHIAWYLMPPQAHAIASPAVTSP